ncbi:MAG: methionyl-tRNA formyltransferase [Bacteroidales bacterium]|nr:methionyl-tRNA formyltransferase [Candidatus Colicola faecequi]
MEKKDLRIIYMGTPDFAVASFAALVENGYNVVACVTMPDKPAGRGHHLQYSPVKEYALEHQIPVLQPEKLKDEMFLEELRSYNADLQIVVAFRMLPEVVWNMPRLGTFNLHASLLPQYRGAAPINWAVINGDKRTGITTFFLKHEIDTGNLILQQEIEIGEDENVGSVHDRLMELGKDLVLKTVDLIIESETTGVPVKTTPQVESEDLRPAPKIFKETCEIDFGKTSAEVKNFVRGLSPYPAAWCNLTIGEKTFENVKVYAVCPSNGGNPLSVKTTDGYVDILELQVPGKKRMAARDFLNGIR